MDWVKLAILVLQLAGQFADWVEREKIRTEAERKLLQEARERIDASNKKADEAAARVDADLSAHPERVRDDDGFRRD